MDPRLRPTLRPALLLALVVPLLGCPDDGGDLAGSDGVPQLLGPVLDLTDVCLVR